MKQVFIYVGVYVAVISTLILMCVFHGFGVMGTVTRGNPAVYEDGVFKMRPSSFNFTGGGVSVSSSPSGVTITISSDSVSVLNSTLTYILEGNATAYVNINESTQTKTGGLNIYGSVGIGTGTVRTKLGVLGNVAIGTWDKDSSFPENGLAVTGKTQFGGNTAFDLSYAGAIFTHGGNIPYSILISTVQNLDQLGEMAGVYQDTNFSQTATSVDAFAYRNSPIFTTTTGESVDGYTFYSAPRHVISGSGSRHIHGGYFARPSGTGTPTSKNALYTDDLNIGYTDLTPPTSGAIVAGRFGIGNSSPTSLLDVSGGSITVRNSAGIRISSGGLQWPDGTIQVSSPPSTIGFATIAQVNSTQSYILQGNATAYITVNGSTQTKAGSLIVNGYVTTKSGIVFPDGSTQTAAPGSSQWATNGSNIYNTNSGNIGMGASNTNPNSLVEIEGNYFSSNSFTFNSIGRQHAFSSFDSTSTINFRNIIPAAYRIPDFGNALTIGYNFMVTTGPVWATELCAYSTTTNVFNGGSRDVALYNNSGTFLSSITISAAASPEVLNFRCGPMPALIELTERATYYIMQLQPGDTSYCSDTSVQHVNPRFQWIAPKSAVSNTPSWTNGNSAGFGSYFGPGLKFISSTSTLVVKDGYVGIGIANPANPLDIRNSILGTQIRSVNTTASGATSGSFLGLFADDGTPMVSGDRLGGIFIGGARDTSSTLSNAAAITAFATQNWTGTTAATDIGFESVSSGTVVRSEKMRITSTGNVGIGTNAPIGKLHVAGTGNTIVLDNAGQIKATSANGNIVNMLTHWSDDTLFFDNNSGAISIRNGNTLSNNAVYISSGTGNVGIGITGPQTTLAVNGSIQWGGGTSVAFGTGTVSSDSNWGGYFRGRAGTISDLAFVPRGGDAAQTTGMFMNSSGNIGIGTTSPTEKLHIMTGNIKIQSAGNNDLIFDTANRPSIYQNATNVGLQVRSNGSGRLELNNDNSGNIYMAGGGGNVGIGDPTPEAKFEVLGSSVPSTAGQLSELARFTTADDNSNILRIINYRKSNGTNHATAEQRIVRQIDVSTMGFVGFGSNYLALGGNGIENVRIASDGKVGIGTTSPGAKVHVFGAAADQIIEGSGDHNYFMKTDASNYGQIYWDGTNRDLHLLAADGSDANGRIIFKPDGVQVMTLLRTGNVGIGTTGPVRTLQVAGDARVGTGTTGCVEDADGTVIAGTCSSDERFKTVVGTMAMVLSSFTMLEPKYYHWRFGEYPTEAWGSAKQLGLVAQDVEPIIPELVFNDDNGFKKVRYEQLPMYFLKSMKEMYDEIQTLKRKIEILEGGGQ